MNINNNNNISNTHPFPLCPPSPPFPQGRLWIANALLHTIRLHLEAEAEDGEGGGGGGGVGGGGVGAWVRGARARQAAHARKMTEEERMRALRCRGGQTLRHVTPSFGVICNVVIYIGALYKGHRLPSVQSSGGP